jgi:hypothetical protein
MSGPNPADKSRSPIKRGAQFIKWLVPGAILVLLPKCPACLAAYIAVATGIGLSIPAAAHLRWMLILACVISLCYLVATQVRRKTTPAILNRKANHC